MEPLAVVLFIVSIFALRGYYKFIKWIILLFRRSDERRFIDQQTLIIVINFIMPFWCIASLHFIKKDFEVFDWHYLYSLYTLLSISLCCYIVSFFMKESIGPLLLFILYIGRNLGIILLIIMLIHLHFAFPFALLPPFIFIFLPLYAIIPSILLFIIELRLLYRFIIERASSLEIPLDSKWLQFLRKIPVFLPL